MFCKYYNINGPSDLACLRVVPNKILQPLTEGTCSATVPSSQASKKRLQWEI